MRRALTYLPLLVLLPIAAWFYYGFFFPDPLYTEVQPSILVHATLTIIRVGFPFLVLMAVILWVRIVRGSLRLYNAGLVALGIVAGTAVLYLVGGHIYYHRLLSGPTADFHPYLQLRPPEFKLRASSATTFKIICLGGSTTGWENSLGEHWSHLLENELWTMHLGRPVEVYNQGREWYTSLHSLINYQINLRQYHPDLLIVMHSINDLMHNADFGYHSFAPFRHDYGHYSGPVTSLLQRKTFFGALALFSNQLWYHKERVTVAPRTLPGLTSFRLNLGALLDLASSDGVKVLFMTEPYLYRADLNAPERAKLKMLNTEGIGPDKQWDLETILNGMELYNRAIMGMAEDKRALVFDLERQIPKTLEYFRDDVHYTDKAFPLLAKSIAGEIVRQRILQ